MGSLEEIKKISNKTVSNTTAQSQTNKLAAMRPREPIPGRVITHSYNPRDGRIITESDNSSLETDK